MKTFAKVASASFAHLAGLGRGKAAKAEDNDDDKKDRDHEDVEDGVKKGKAEDDEPEKKDDDKKPDSKAEDDDPDASASGDDLPTSDDGDEDDDGDKKGKKAKKAEDEKDDEKMKAAALKERARCAAIFASPAAARNVKMAAELAFNTDLSSAQAIAVLQTAPASASNPNRAAGNPRIAGSGAPEVTGKQAVDSSWDRAFAQVNPQKRR